MNYEELFSKEDAGAFIELLSETCRVRKPKLRFTGRNRGHYRPRSRTIIVGPRSAAWILLHEFTHHLNHIENGDCGNESREPHSQAFYYKLRRLTQLLGGEYPWSKEYKQLKRWAGEGAQKP